jgi:hypothetical protein
MDFPIKCFKCGKWIWVSFLTWFRVLILKDREWIPICKDCFELASGITPKNRI